MKKWIWGVSIVSALLIVGAFLLGRYTFPAEQLAVLPAPEVSDGQRGELGIDKNVNEATIDKYLGRSDAVYRDLRMLKDPGNYEAIGGDSYLSGFVNGYEVVPLPYIVNVTGLPAEVGDTYDGDTLFTDKGNGNYVANYKESMEILEALFPKDKVIFLMCGGGGYSGMMKNMLVALGWDGSRIYNTGGYWFYEGDNNVAVKRVNADGKTVYDFYKVPYHEIDFDVLTEK
jgi:rhodanese-related sulfurtransferase